MAESKNIRPIGPNILVRPEQAETTSKMGVVIMEKEQERPQKGEVIALGTGVYLPDGSVSQFVVKVGDTVVFKKYGGTEVEINGEKLMVMTENDILGIME